MLHTASKTKTTTNTSQWMHTHTKIVSRSDMKMVTHFAWSDASLNVLLVKLFVCPAKHVCRLSPSGVSLNMLTCKLFCCPVRCFCGATCWGRVRSRRWICTSGTMGPSTAGGSWRGSSTWTTTSSSWRLKCAALQTPDTPSSSSWRISSMLWSRWCFRFCFS